MLCFDPAQIAVSRWAPRQEQRFSSSAFLELKESIRHDGENQVPILVRPLRPKAYTADAPRYELAYGHRRLRACRELGIAIRAIVEELTQARLVERMHAENRERASLSAYEAGLFYRQRLDAKLYGSQRQIAEALGIDQADATRKIWLARRPAEFIQIFRSPLEIGCDDIRRLQSVWKHDAAGVQALAQIMLDADGPQPAKQAIARLAGGGLLPGDGGSIANGLGRSSGQSGSGRAVVEIKASGPERMTFRVNTSLALADRDELKRQVELFAQERSRTRE